MPERAAAKNFKETEHKGQVHSIKCFDVTLQRRCTLQNHCTESSFIPHILSPLFCLQTSIIVEFKPISSVTTYELQWKDIEQQWSNASSNSVTAGAKKKCQAEATDLNPGTTYCVRLVCISQGSKGAPGSELIIDTEQVGCAPKTGGGCTIL